MRKMLGLLLVLLLPKCVLSREDQCGTDGRTYCLFNINSDMKQAKV